MEENLAFYTLEWYVLPLSIKSKILLIWCACMAEGKKELISCSNSLYLYGRVHVHHVGFKVGIDDVPKKKKWWWLMGFELYPINLSLVGDEDIAAEGDKLLLDNIF